MADTRTHLANAAGIAQPPEHEHLGHSRLAGGGGSGEDKVPSAQYAWLIQRFRLCASSLLYTPLAVSDETCDKFSCRERGLH